MLCQKEEREAGREYPRTCPTCRLGPCQKFGAKPLQALVEAQAEIDRLTAERDQARAQIAAVIEQTKAALAMGDAGYRVDYNPDATAALTQMLNKAYKAGQRDMRERAAHLIECDGDALGGKSGAAKAIRALPIKERNE